MKFVRDVVVRPVYLTHACPTENAQNHVVIFLVIVITLRRAALAYFANLNVVIDNCIRIAVKALGTLSHLVLAEVAYMLLVFF